MKRILTIMCVSLLFLSMFSMFAPQAKAESAYLANIVQLTTNPYDDRGAGWSPDSSKITYSAFAGSWYRNIWVMNSDGSNKEQLTFGNVVDDAPAYSPDGTKIVFMRYGLRGIDGSDLMIMNADGTNIQQLTSTGLHRGEPRWSHDGQKLAFYYGGAGTPTWEIHIMNADGTNEVTVVSSTSPESAMNPAWSPDDTKLVYTMDDGIWTVNTSPPYQTTHVFQTSSPTTYAVYSPDGNYIMYASGVYGQLQDLYLIDIYGNFIAQLTYDTKFGYIFDWSPDGQYIAFNSISSGNYDIWRANIVVSNALVGYWKFDEGSGTIAHDSSGNSFDGTIYGATWVDGVVSEALHFDGASNYVAVPDNPSLSGFTQLTLEAWIRPDSLTSGYLTGIINKGNGGGYYGDEYGLQLDNDMVRFILSAGDPTGWIIVVDTDPVISVGQWYHVAAVWDSNNYYIYVNGQLVKSGQTIVAGATIHDTSHSLNIGGIAAGGWLFNGAIDEAKIFNYARTAEEIWNDYISVSLPQADFDIAVSPESQVAQPYSSVDYQIAITSKNGFTSGVTLDASFSPYPVHIGWTFDPGVVKPPPNGEAFSTLRVNVYEDTPLKTFTITVTATSGAVGKPDDVKLNVERSLEVPYQSQDNTEWCGPTSLAMVLNYYGIVFHSWDYAEDENKGTNDGVYINELKIYVDENYDDQPYSLTTKYRNYVQDSTPPSDKLLDTRSNITLGYPVLLNLVTLDKTKAHTVVATGFNETGVFVNDPSGAMFGPDFLKLNLDPIPKIHAYANWDATAQFIAESLTVKGQPSSLIATVDLEKRDMFFADEEGTVYSEYNALDGGLVWYPEKVVRANPDYTFYYTVNVNNPRNCKQDFTVWVSLVGQISKSAYVTSYSSSSQLSLDAYTRGYTQQQSIRLGDYLSGKVNFYHVKVQLCDSQGNVIDWFTTGIHGESKTNSYIHYSDKGTTAKLKESRHHLYLHVYDPQRNHVGLDYATGQVELGILGSYYFDDQNGTITVIVPQVINLTIIVDAKYGEDPVESYDLLVMLRTNMGVYSQTCSKNITAGQSQTFTAIASETALELCSWDYVFIDGKRGTELRINPKEKIFQFIAPDKDFGVKHDPKMKMLNHVIIICYQDSHMQLVATAVDDKIDFCLAIALDKQTGKIYLLIDKPDLRRGSCSCFPL